MKQKHRPEAYESFVSDQNQAAAENFDVVIMRHDERRRIMRNRNHLGLILNVLTFSGIVFAASDDSWFSYTKDSDAYNYGLLYYSRCTSVNKACIPDSKVYRFCSISKNLFEQGGLITFFVQGIGIILQLVLLIQTLAFSLAKRCKIVKFKVLRYFTMLFYSAGNAYYFLTVIFPAITSKDYQSFLVGYDFYVSCFCLLAFYLVCLYFSWLKRRQVDADMVNNLLHANTLIRQEQEDQEAISANSRSSHHQQ